MLVICEEIVVKKLPKKKKTLYKGLKEFRNELSLVVFNIVIWFDFLVVVLIMWSKL